MAASLNKVTLIGNLGQDPEVKIIQDGPKIVKLSIATTESWKDKNTGERKDKTEWHRVVIMNERLSEIAERYLKKGSKVYIEGQLQTRKWADKAGAEHTTTEIVISRFKGEIVMLDSKNSNNESGGAATVQASNKKTFGNIDYGDDMPF